MRPRRLTWLAMTAATLAASSAAAQTDAAAAGQLFDKGLADMKAQRYASGCPAIAESQRLDPRPGTLFTLAVCEGSWGKTASAMAHFDDYLSLYERLPIDQKQRQRGRDKVARHQLDELRRKVSWLTVRLPDSAPSDVVVKRDGEVLGAPSLGVALPVDPGTHTITVEDSEGTKSLELTLHDADRREVEAPLPPPRPKRARESARPLMVFAESQPPARTSSAPAWGWSLIGVGVASLVAGGITGGLVFGEKATIDLHCPNVGGLQQCDDTGRSAVDTARALAAASEISLVAGGVLFVAGAIVLLVLPGHRTHAQGSMAISPAGVGVRW